MTGPEAGLPADAGAVLRGTALMATAMLIVPAMDAIAKLLGAELSALQVGWGRFFFQALLLTPLALYSGGVASLRTRRPLAQCLRGVLMAAATVLFFFALTFMPIADAIAIFFIEPLLLVLLSALCLGEQVGWRRLAAIAVGFGGALLVIRPSFTAVGWPALLPLATALCFALYLTLTRSLAGDIGAIGTQVWTGWVAGLALTLLLIGASAAGWEAVWRWPTPRQWSLLALLGCIATGTHLLIALAFRLTPAAVLAPFQYLEIISATLLGWWLFGDLPRPLTWLGVAVIVGSGLFVYWRERRLARR